MDTGYDCDVVEVGGPSITLLANGMTIPKMKKANEARRTRMVKMLSPDEAAGLSSLMG